jgi:hypothetical protein
MTQIYPLSCTEFQIQNHLDVGLTAQQTITQAASKNSTEVLRNLATSLGISDRIFQWTCLRAKANLQAWGEIQAIFQTKVCFHSCYRLPREKTYKIDSKK